MTLFLTLLSGISWMLVYIDCIRLGIKQKTYGIPLFALALNIAWEGLYSFLGLKLPIRIQTIVNIIWFIFDLIIVVSYFKYGKNDFPKSAKKYFIPFSILTFASCLALQLAFYWEFGYSHGPIYSAFLQNVVMSILFIIMLFHRNSKKEQSMVIAVAKWLGTLAPSILMGVVQGINVYVITCGILCSIFDILYIILLLNWNKIL